MTNEEFDLIFNTIVDRCREIHRTKGQQYANGGDRLGNFKRAAARKGVQPETIISIYGDKHFDSIEWITRQIEETGKVPSTAEPLMDSFCDIVNYYVLRYAAILERLNGGVARPSKESK